MQDDKRICPTCRCRAWKNRDLGVELQLPLASTPQTPLIVRGNIDFVVAMTPQHGYVSDAKSIKAEDFDLLKDATIDYKRQVRLYMWLANHKKARILGEPRVGAEKFKIDPRLGVISYCVKGARQEPFKIFNVEQDRPFIKQIDTRLQALVKHIDEGTAPDRICASQANMMARNCAARTLCFEGEGH
jgi:hypothetical protein